MMKFELSRSPFHTARVLFRAIFLLLLMASSILAAQQPDGAANAQTEIARLEGRWLKAIETSDMSTLNSILAVDFVRPTPTAGQFITKAQLLKYYQSHPAKSVPAHKHIENLRVTIYADAAIARGFVVISDDRGRAVSKSLFTDMFVERSGRWQAVSAQEN